MHDLEAGDVPVEGLELRRVRLVHPTGRGHVRDQLQDVEIVTVSCPA